MSNPSRSLVARGRVALVGGLVAVTLAIAGCDSSSGDDADAAASTEPVQSSSPSTEADGTSAAPTNTYVVDSGDTLSGIAASYGLSLDELVEVNDWSDGADHAIFPGDVIGLPDDAVAVSTTRPPSNGNNDDNGEVDEGDDSGAPTLATTRGGYTATSGPSIDGLTLTFSDPVADGVYLSFTPAVSADGSTITFELLQCPADSGTAPNGCLTFLDFEHSGATVSMRVGSGTVSVLDPDGISAPDSYRITSEELARLLAGEPPANDAPDGFTFDTVDPYVVTVQNGAATAAEQTSIS
jgi:LysM repeat protein